jgi:CBS domain-containing protein
MEEYEDFRSKYNKMTTARLTNLSDENSGTVTQSTYKSVGGSMTTPVCTIHKGESIFEASRVMAERKIGSLVVVDDLGKLEGLLTTKNLVHQYLAHSDRNSVSEAVSSYMNSEPIAIPAEFPIVEAIAEMNHTGEDYAVVVKSGKPLGLISNTDLMHVVFQNTNIYNTHINAMETLDQLKEAHFKLYLIAENLVSNSRLTSSVLPIISAIHLNIQKKVFKITFDSLDENIVETFKRVPNSMIIMGSGGRKEMMLDPDQDHAFVLSNDATDEDKADFIKFGEIFSHNLAYVGYELCKGNIMASNPEMVKTIKEWRKTISEWINNPGSEGFLWSSVFFDMDRFEGDETLVWDLKEFIAEAVPQKPVFLIQMLERDTNIKPPISLFGKFNLEKEGPNKGTINLKTAALTFLVDVTRAFALNSGISDLNTLERVKHLGRKGVLSEETVQQVIGAYETCVDILFKEQIYQVESGNPPTKNINPKELSLYNQERLKGSLQFVSKYLTKGLKYLKGAP